MTVSVVSGLGLIWFAVFVLGIFAVFRDPGFVGVVLLCCCWASRGEMARLFACIR